MNRASAGNVAGHTAWQVTAAAFLAHWLDEHLGLDIQSDPAHMAMLLAGFGAVVAGAKQLLLAAMDGRITRREARQILGAGQAEYGRTRRRFRDEAPIADGEGAA